MSQDDKCELWDCCGRHAGMRAWVAWATSARYLARRPNHFVCAYRPMLTVSWEMG